MKMIPLFKALWLSYEKMSDFSVESFKLASVGFPGFHRPFLTSAV
jgi:hypothetical protein